MIKTNNQNNKQTIVLNKNGILVECNSLQKIQPVEYNIYMKKIELTNLSPIAISNDIKNLCQKAISYKFYGVCVNPRYVPYVFEILKNYNNINIATVVDYPLGESLFKTKIYELKTLFATGANIVDVYIANSVIKNKDFSVIKEQIQKLAHLADDKKNRRVRIVLDTRYLNFEEILTICQYCIHYKMHYVTITEGTSSSNLNLKLIEKICDALGNKIKIKLNYNVKNVAELKNPAFRNIDLFATTHGVNIAEELKQLLR